MMKNKELIALALCIVAMMTRFIFIVDGQSILPNFTAVGAIAIVSTKFYSGLNKWLIPVLLFWVSDLILNNVVYAQYYEGFQFFSSFWSYAALIAIGGAAWVILKKVNWKTTLVTSCLGAVIFYLISNFGVWVNPGTPYTKDLNGLVQCYTAALPFFRNTLLADIFFSFALFGLYDIIATRISSIRPILFFKHT